MKRIGQISRGFSVVELLIAVSVVAVIAAIAIPHYAKARKNAQSTDFTSELRTTAEAFQMYAAENNGFPPTTEALSKIPEGMDLYLPKNSTWQSSPPIGGHWYWIRWPSGLWGYDGYLMLFRPGADLEQMRMIDETVDDGVLTTGAFRASEERWFILGMK